MEVLRNYSESLLAFRLVSRPVIAKTESGSRYVSDFELVAFCWRIENVSFETVAPLFERARPSSNESLSNVGFDTAALRDIAHGNGRSVGISIVALCLKSFRKFPNRF